MSRKGYEERRQLPSLSEIFPARSGAPTNTRRIGDDYVRRYLNLEGYDEDHKDACEKPVAEFLRDSSEPSPPEPFEYAREDYKNWLSSNSGCAECASRWSNDVRELASENRVPVIDSVDYPANCPCAVCLEGSNCIVPGVLYACEEHFDLEEFDLHSRCPSWMRKTDFNSLSNSAGIDMGSNSDSNNVFVQPSEIFSLEDGQDLQGDLGLGGDQNAAEQLMNSIVEQSGQYAFVDHQALRDAAEMNSLEMGVVESTHQKQKARSKRKRVQPAQENDVDLLVGQDMEAFVGAAPSRPGRKRSRSKPQGDPQDGGIKEPGHSSDEGTVPADSEEYSKPRPNTAKRKHDRDIYTPHWVRYFGNPKEGLCENCDPPKWLRLKNSSYWYHQHFIHGISSVSCERFSPPMLCRQVDERLEGLCHNCKQWIVMRLNNSKAPRADMDQTETKSWFKHAQKCHFVKR